MRVVRGPWDEPVVFRTAAELFIECPECHTARGDVNDGLIPLDMVIEVARRQLSFLNSTFNKAVRMVLINWRGKRIESDPGIRVTQEIWRFIEPRLLGFVHPAEPNIIFLIVDNIQRAASRSEDPARSIANTVRHEFMHSLTLAFNPSVRREQAETVARWFER